MSLGRTTDAPAAPVSAPVSTGTSPAIAGRPAAFTGLSATATEATKPTPITEMLVQGARVLAIGQNKDVGTEKAEVVKTATLEVTPAQAAKLALGQTVGTLTLSLRPLADEARTEVAVLRVDDLHDGSARTVRVTRTVRRTVRHTEPPTVEVIRGGGKDKGSFVPTIYPVSGL